MDSLGIPTLAQGRYRLEEVLGQGGMATVYRALDTRLGVERAIKVLEPAFVRSSNIRARFETEARTMAQLTHPNILQVVDVAEDEKRFFIVMSIAAGGSLWDRVQELGPLSASLACGLLAAVSDAAGLAHEHGVVHRDIKPQNILLSADGTPLLTDFGIAQVQDPARQQALTRTGTVMGTWAYMAPEQRSSAREADARTDVYALGASLYSLVVGDAPPDLFAASMDASLLAGLEPRLGKLIERATRYHKEERFASAADLAEALRALSAGLPPPDASALAMLRVPLTQSGHGKPHPDSGSGRVAVSDGGTVAGLLDGDPLADRVHEPALPQSGKADPLVRFDAVGRAPTWRHPVVAGVVALLLVVCVVGLVLSSALPPDRALREPSSAGPPSSIPVPGRPPTAESVLPERGRSGAPPDVEARPLPEPEPDARSGRGRDDATPGAVPNENTPQNAGEATLDAPLAEGLAAPEEQPNAVATSPVASVAPAPSAPDPARVRIEGDVSDVIFVDVVSGEEHAPPGPIPPGSYRMLARFPGTTQRTVALRIDLGPGEQVVLSCDGIFDKCSVAP